jgi:hypothetical protein
MSGFCIFLGDNLISWSSRRQPTVSRSSAEAEYRAVATAVAETCWLRNLLLELHRPLDKATVVYFDNISVVYIYFDNISVVYMSANPVQHRRTKYIELDIHFVREKSCSRCSSGSSCSFSFPICRDFHQRLSDSAVC